MSEEKPSEEHQQPGIGGESDSAAADPVGDYVFGLQTPLDLATSAEIQPARSDQAASAAPGDPSNTGSQSNTGSSSNPASPSNSTAQSNSASPSNAAGDDDGDVPPPPTYADLAKKNLPAKVSTTPQSSASAGNNAQPASTASNPQPASTAGNPQPASTASNPQPSSTGSNPQPSPNTTDAPSASSLPASATADAQGVVPEPGASKFAVDEVISFGWKEMLKYFWPLTGVMTCTFLVQMVPTISSIVLKYLVSQTAAVGALSLIVSLVGAIIGVVIGLGTLNLFLKVVEGDTLAVRDVFSKYSRAWNFALASLLYGLMVGAGYVCLIIPGVYLQLRFQFYPYFILDSDAGPLTSLKASWAITRGSVAEVFFLGIVNYFINWVGLLCLVIGMFPAYIVQNIALAKTYRQLRANTPLSEMPPNLMPLALISDSESSQRAG